MADRASDENTEPDLNWRSVGRRSSILKPTRPILESVENTTEDVTERRRLSKRVSFSDTHQIKLFKCEISDGCDSASQSGSVFTSGDKTLTDSAAEDQVDGALQLLQCDHTPLEQSFYLAVDDISGSTEATSPTKRTSILMEEAESCLVFGQLGNKSATSDGACYRAGLDKTTLAQCTLDITCCSSRATNQTAAEFTQSVLADEMMETTMGATDHNQSAGALPKTMFGDKSMKTTIGAADHNQSAGTLTKTMFGDKSMEMTVFSGSSVPVEAAENLSKTHIFPGDVMDITVGPQDSTRFGGNATVPLQDTMNMTCAVGSTSFATGAADKTDTGAVNHVGQITVPAVETAAGGCSTASPVGQHDVATFLASFRKCDSAGPPGMELLDAKWVDEAESPTTSAPYVSCGSISRTPEPFDLAALVALNRCADASSLLGEDAGCAEVPHVQPDPALCSAIHSNTTHVGMQSSVEETNSAHLSTKKTSMTADYRPAAMNVAGLDTFARLPNADDLSCADNIAPVGLASDGHGNNHQVLDDSQAKLLTSGLSDALCPKTSLAVITSLQRLQNKSSDGVGTDIDDSGGSVPHAAGKSGTMCRGNISDAGKTCLLPGAMDTTCTSPTSPISDSETASSGPGTGSEKIGNLTTKTIDVMNMTCADPVGSTHPACSSTNPAWMTLHFKDANMTREMNMTCVNTTGCSPIVEVMADLSTEPNELLNKGAPPRVADRSHKGTDENSLNEVVRLCRSEGANVDTGDIEADRGGNPDGTAEGMRLDPQVSSAASLNVTARGRSAVHSSCSLHLRAVREVGLAASTADLSKAMPQDLPVLAEMTAPSFLKTTRQHEKADNMCHSERSVSGASPTRCTSQKGSTNVCTKGTGSKRPDPYVPLTGVLNDKDSIALQRLASPVAKKSCEVSQTRTPTVAPPSLNKRSTASEMNLSAAANIVNSLTDSAVNISNVSALLEMPTGYASSLTILDDVLLPEKVAEGNAHTLSCRASASKSLSKVGRQTGSASHSRLASVQGQNTTDSVEVRGKLEQIMGPDADAQQEQAVVSLSTSKKGLFAATSNSGVSAKKSPFMGVSNSGVSEVNPRSVSKQPDVAVEKRAMEDLATTAGELLQTGATPLSPVTRPSATSAPDTRSIGASLSKCQHDGSRAVKASTYVTDDELAQKSVKLKASTEPVRKSATFVVTPGKGTRPSATFAVSSPSHSVICIDNCTTVDEANKDVPLETEDCCTSSTHCVLAEQPAAAVHQSHVRCSDEGTATSRSRKRLEFTVIKPRSSCNATEPRAHRNVTSVSVSSRTPSDMCRSQTLPNHGEASCHEPHHALLTSPSKVLQCSTVSCADYGTMLMDLTEPSLVGDSLKTSSADSLQTSRCNETTGQPVCHTQVGEPTRGADASPSNSVSIPTNMFYSSSTKKRCKPPGTPSSTLSDKHKSMAKKRRLGKAAAKSSGSKRQYCSPVSTGKKRPPVPQERTSAAKSARKAPDSGTSARKTTRQRTEPSRSTDADILQSVFPCRPKLRSPQKSPDASPAATDSSISLEWPELSDSVKLPDDLSIEGLQAAADAALAKIAERSEELTGTDEVKLPVSSTERVMNLDDSDFEMSDPELDLTANIDILGIIDRLDDMNAKQTLYWSFYEIPEEMRKDWQLEERLLEKDMAVFSFIKGRVKLLVTLGDYVKLLDMEDKLTLARAAASGEVRHRTKFIAGLQYKVTCRPKAHFNKYLLHHHLQNVHSTDKLLEKYPTTDCLGKLLADLGNFFVRYRPLSWDLGILAKNHYYTFENSVASFQIIAPKHLIWFHLDLPIDLETYPNAVIVPSLRPYSDEFDVLTTEKLRRIAARVEPGTDYLIRMVGEIEEFLEK